MRLIIIENKIKDKFFIENPQYVATKELFKKKIFDMCLNEFKNRIDYGDHEDTIF